MTQAEVAALRLAMESGFREIRMILNGEDGTGGLFGTINEHHNEWQVWTKEHEILHANLQADDRTEAAARSDRWWFLRAIEQHWQLAVVAVAVAAFLVTHVSVDLTGVFQ